MCGWRKTEALTATTRERSKATLKSLANFDRDEKPSGVSIDKEKGTQLSAGDERELRQLNLAKTLSKFN